jgi:hypothetical protein
MASDESRQTALEQLVSLINTTASFEATWVRFHLLLQAGLAAAFWAVAAYTPGVPLVGATQTEPPRAATPSEELRSLISLLIPFFGMVFCVAVTIIHVGVQRWARWYICRIRDLHLAATIFPPPRQGEQEATSHRELPISQRAWVILVVNVVIIVAWAVAGGLLLASTGASGASVTAIPTLMVFAAVGIIYWRVRRKSHVTKSHVLRFTFSVGRIVRVACRWRTRGKRVGRPTRLAVRLEC